MRGSANIGSFVSTATNKDTNSVMLFGNSQIQERGASRRKSSRLSKGSRDKSTEKSSSVYKSLALNNDEAGNPLNQAFNNIAVSSRNQSDFIKPYSHNPQSH